MPEGGGPFDFPRSVVFLAKAGPVHRVRPRAPRGACEVLLETRAQSSGLRHETQASYRGGMVAACHPVISSLGRDVAVLNLRTNVNKSRTTRSLRAR